MTAKSAILLAGTAISESDRRMRKLLDFLGVPCHLMITQPGAGSLPKLDRELDPSKCGLIVSANTLLQLLRQPAAHHDQIRGFVNSFASSFIFCVAPTALEPAQLKFLTEGRAEHYEVLNKTEKFLVSSRHSTFFGPLAGLLVDHQSGGPSCVIQIKPNTPGCNALVEVDTGASLASFESANTQIFLSTSNQVVDLDERVSANFDASAHFHNLVPYLAYMRHAFSDVCWRPNTPRACLVIDDPPLRKRYGFLNIAELVDLLNESRCAASLGFIPWNCDRSKRPVANLVRDTKRLGLCIHGCDHTGSEFGSHDEGWLDDLAQLALQRMASHQSLTGIAHEKIMVFPQGVFSRAAMGILKRRNFVAAVNTEVVPHHNAAEHDKIRLAEVLGTAIIAYSSFALFSRRRCTEPLVNYALDAFLGKPCLLVAHHDYFRSGFSQLREFVSALNKMIPELEWVSLETAVAGSYAWRHPEHGSTAIRIYANRAVLENRGGSLMTCLVSKPENDASSVDCVLVDEARVLFDSDGQHINFSCSLRPGQKANVAVRYREPDARKQVPMRLRYRAKAAARRYLSEVRDDYLLPLRHCLQAEESPRGSE